MGGISMTCLGVSASYCDWSKLKIIFQSQILQTRFSKKFGKMCRNSFDFFLSSCFLFYSFSFYIEGDIKIFEMLFCLFHANLDRAHLNGRGGKIIENPTICVLIVLTSVINLFVIVINMKLSLIIIVKCMI